MQTDGSKSTKATKAGRGRILHTPADRQALVRVWRKPVDQTLELDGQGRVRIYLQDAQKQAAAGQMRELPEYSAQLELAGRCG